MSRTFAVSRVGVLATVMTTLRASAVLDSFRVPAGKLTLVDR